MNKLLISAIALVALTTTASLTGCSGGGGDSTPTTGTSVLTGTFVDAPVEGLIYSTETQLGTTDGNGRYEYKSGETIIFKIGNLTLGSVSAKKIITPLTLGGDTNLNTIGTKAKNIARILQSLDDNPSDTSKITIPSMLADLNVTNIDLLDDADLQTILTRANGITSESYILKSSEDATTTMKTFLQTYLYVGAYSATSVYSNNSTLLASQCGGTMQWSIQVANDGVVTGTNSDASLNIIGLSISDSTIAGIADDETTWITIINEDGAITGTYNWGNGQCVGTISGTKN